jgi:selenocysteine-specific translation elongation factor
MMPWSMSTASPDGCVVAGRVRVCGFDAVLLAVDELADHAGEHLSVADLQILAPTGVVVLPGL